MAARKWSAVFALALLRPAVADGGNLRGGAANATSIGAPMPPPSDEAPELLLGNASEALQSLEALASELAGNTSEAAALEFAGNESALAKESEELEAEANAQWWHRGHHHHHHHHPGPVRNIMTLYHTTSPAAASAILGSGFRPGHSGWCGGAIYFVATPVLPRTKYGPDTHAGAVIQATVDMGRMATMDRRCRSSFGTGTRAARRGGYDSLRFDPGDGAEYVIASASRVLSMRRYK